MTLDSVGIGTALAAIGALGTAAFGLVDSLKMFPRGGISNAGYGSIVSAVKCFFPAANDKSDTQDTRMLLDVLHGNWINGTPMGDQKAIAKSLIKLRLNGDTAVAFARATRVDAATLKTVGEKMAAGTRLDPGEMNVLGRFDLALTAILDDGYQHGDEKYRTTSKFAATLIAVVLAVCGGMIVTDHAAFSSDWLLNIALCFFAGLIAAPLAPVTKDLASALSAGVRVAQAVGK